MTQDELNLVLDALNFCHGGEPCGTAEAIAVVEKALTQPEQLHASEDVSIGVDVTEDGAHVTALRSYRNGAKVVFYSQFHSAPQTEQEPVAFENWHKANYVQNLERYGDTYKNNHVRCRHQGWLGAQSSSPQRTWAGLTDKVITQVIDSMPKKMRGFIVDWDLYELARAIESKLKQKNGFTEEKNT